MLQKQAVPINFAQGLDEKTDPFQVTPGNFLALTNSVFTKGKKMTKRNGYGELARLPSPSSFGTTFNGDLTAVGSQIEAYSTGTNSWYSKGRITPLTLSTLPLIRNNLNQSYADSTIAPNGYVCTAYTQSTGSATTYWYAIADSVTGQNIVAPTQLTGADATYGTPKVFTLGAWFVIVYSSTSSHLSYIAVSISNPSSVTSQANISTNYAAATTSAFDGFVFSNALYVAWNGASGGIHAAYIINTAPGSSAPVSAAFVIDASHTATLMSVTADITHGVIWASYYNSGSSTGYSVAFNPAPLLTVLPNFPTEIITTGTISNITSVAQFGIATVFYETVLTVDGVSANFVSSETILQTTGVVSSPIVVLRSVGLASKAFIINQTTAAAGRIYFLSVYDSFTSSVPAYQPTYFLVDGVNSTSANPVVVAKLAYENGGTYCVTGLPSVSSMTTGSTASIAYLYKDLIQALSNANAAGTITQGGIYSQTGVNLVSFDFTSTGLTASEIGANLNIAGCGFLQAYDGYLPVENNFHLYPDNVIATGVTSGGHITDQQYFWQVTYEWSDNQGNAFRSAGSIPVTLTTSGGGHSVVTLVIPTLRITAKTANPVKICVYRWSAGQEEFFQVGNNGANPITSPVLNDTTVDSITFTDISADTTIAGNNILYTTGGVIEDSGAPASSAMTLFDDRLWLVDSEDPSLLWYSKQIIEATPVEMSNLLTVYVAPSLGATGPTGPALSLSAMDDKLIIFKKNASYYINGTGPDNTGTNNQYSSPTFITSMVGCSNQNSIVFQPSGLMFEFASESGSQIWILKRDLQTEYIGAPVEGLIGNATVLSAIAVPGTNEVRFNLSSGITLKYDYFYGQWGTHTTNAVSSTVFQGLHTYIDPYGAVYQETPGKYLDGTNPVLLGLTTAWLNLAGLQGYQRVYFFYLLGEYFSPFRLQYSVAYDYEPPSSFGVIQPVNYGPVYGGAEANGQNTTYGSDSPYGNQSNILNWRIFMEKQRCIAFQISLQEIYDPSFGVVAGQGFSLSGINAVVALKKDFHPQSAALTQGAS